MPARLTKAQIAQELQINDQLRRTLDQRRIELQEMNKTAFPPEPPSRFTMFTVSVRFKMRGNRYQYLILRSGGHYWTTGTKADQQVFSSWETLCEWLEGPDVYDHTALEILRSNGNAVSFDSGAIEKLDTTQAPF